jgi:multimeric flavodoxin WrbA
MSTNPVSIRKGQPDPTLDHDAFVARYQHHFFDPAFDPMRTQILALAEIAWDAYKEGRKAPRTHPAGPGYKDPGYELSDEWRATSEAIRAAQERQQQPGTPSRLLLICGSPRSEHTCPGEMSKTYRLLEAAHEEALRLGFECDVLELNRLTSEYGRSIHPCKACVSTAMPLCHWPCSCYPNHSLGQTQDWMGEIYPRWVAAHGVVILAPVHWNQATSVLKLMIDRLVCADGGNPDPSSTQGKKPELAKAIELDGWNYPQHLAGRAFAVVVHGDTEGAQKSRHALADWLSETGLIEAGSKSQVDRYIGYYEPYATSHAALDRDEAIFEETRHAVRSLAERVQQLRSGITSPGTELETPRKK